MIKKFKPIEHDLDIKRLMYVIVIIGILLMPDVLLHLLAVIAHTLFESIAAAIEDVLIHGFGFNKFQAQMFVFYTSLAIGILGAIALIRRIPKIASNIRFRMIQSYTKAREDCINTWQALPTRRKLELSLLEIAVLTILIMFVFT